MLERDTYQNHQKNIMRDIEEEDYQYPPMTRCQSILHFMMKKLRENF